MTSFDNHEAWRSIPPEEKLEIMAQANSKATLAVIVTVIIMGTCAVALQTPWILWASLLTAPLVFQFAAGKDWRARKPAMMLKYLAARSASRRYAYTNKSKELNLSLIFRGYVERVIEKENVEETLQAMINQVRELEVWIALFDDIVIVMSEQPGGARLEFSHALNKGLSIESHSESGEDYTSDKEVTLSYENRKGGRCVYRITSQYPGALVVFEKRIKMLQVKGIEDENSLLAEAEAEASAEEAEGDNLGFL